MGLIEMNINDKIYGFTIENIRSTKFGEFIEMRHDKTNASLVWMKNDCENKLFSISFKTVPENDTGVFHILEHSVLGGSENYPVKEPFLYLLKGSMNTFLNAMTFPDKTMYPVSSRNNRDFLNLTRVYLDAVFKPLIYSVPNIFYQEGHHIEYSGNDDEASFKGVVFNEMKGYISSVHERIESEMNSLLYPDTSYRFEFGGLPSAITDLTYEEFIDVHRRYYNPANSYIYLDGAINPDEVLPLIDSYISEFDNTGEKPDIRYQQPCESRVCELCYDSSAESGEESQTYITVGKILGSWNEIEKITAYSVISRAIAGSNDSPLKKAILDSDLCLDVDLSVTDGNLQPNGMLKFYNTDRENGEKLLELTAITVRKLVENGIDRDLLEAAINRCEFIYRESEEPKGLTRCVDAMSSWLYGGDPLMYIDKDEVFSNLRKKLDTDYYENLLEEWLLDENGRAVLYMLPSDTYGEEQTQAEKCRVQSEISAMSDDEKSELIKLNEDLGEWQDTPDSFECIDMLPKLPLTEISSEPVRYITEESVVGGIKVLNHPVSEKEVTVMTLYFDVNDFTADELRKLSVIKRLIAELPTRKSDGVELQKRIEGTLGSLTADIVPIGNEETPESCRVFFELKTRFLSRNFVRALELISELLTETDYTQNDLALRELKQDEENMKQDIISEGHRFSVRRVTANMSAESAVIEFIRGFEAYEALHSINRMSADDFSEYLVELNKLAERTFCKSRLTVSIAAEKEQDIKLLFDTLPQGAPSEKKSMNFSTCVSKNNCIVIPSATAYSGAVLGGQIEDKAAWSVLSTIISYEYLWNEVRVKGGAYGCGCSVNNMKEACFHSYCDPSPRNSFGIFEDTACFIGDYCENAEDISQYIISSIASGEPLVSDAEYVEAADGMYFRGITQESRRKLRREILGMTAERLSKSAKDFGNNMYFCAVSSKDTIDEVIKNYPDRQFDVKNISEI
ncbi:MAG: insulinase family protein [Ruminococcus sp.]|nr:insulinase family protein [Ruminococcus sp.]